MVRFQRSRKCRRHNKEAALRFASQAAALANRIVPEAHFSVFSGRFDSVDRIYWVADLEGLVALETTLEKIESDRRWKKFMAGAPKDLFVDGSAEESVLELAS